jgi:UDP-galactopyranose mutase
MFENIDLIVVGSGLFGSVTAEQASRDGFKVAVVENRKHIGGNCYTEDDPTTGINVHKYGPHIFHTNSDKIWDYIRQFSDFNNYTHKAKTKVNGQLYPFPINLETINKFGNKNWTPAEAGKWLSLVRMQAIEDPANFEEQAIALIGRELYEVFYKGYTLKQWETDPKELPASVARRIPVRTNYNDRFYNHKYEAMPVNGYTPIFERMLGHENIQLYLNTDWFSVRSARDPGQLVVYTGALDRYFDYCFGKLTWRTLDFDWQVHNVGDYQGVCQVNYPGLDVEHTRIIEHRYFHPERNYDPNRTIIHKEYSRQAEGNDVPYYPVNKAEDQARYEKYRDLAEQDPTVIFGGRLGEYKYYDMHQVIGSALSTYSNRIKTALTNQSK